MKGKYFKAILPILSMTASGDVDLAISQREQANQSDEEPHFIQYHNRVILFDPFHQSYERIKPDAFYVGVEGFAVPALNEGRYITFIDAELRMGYNYFYNGRDHLTPFAGIGSVKKLFKNDHRTWRNPDILYGTMGFLYDHEFNDIFNLGINAKLLLGAFVNEKHFDSSSFVMGADISLPMTFRFGRHRHWDYRIEPFNMYLHGSMGSQNYFGFRNSLGYRF